MDLPHDKQFHFSNGTSAKNLNELMDAIQAMSYDQFYNYVNSTKNDFANWIRFVLKDNQLADTLEKVTSIVETIEILNDYMHPKVAQQHLEAQDDIQSQIEKEILEVPSFPEEPPNFDDLVSPEPVEAPVAETVDVPIESNEPSESETSPDVPPVDEKPVDEKPQIVEKKLEAAIPHDVGKLIVKDFIYGLLVGLIIGLILGRVISIGF